LVMRSHLGGVGCCHWSFVSLVSPRGMEFVRQVSHADLRVRDSTIEVSMCPPSVPKDVDS